MNPKFKVSDLVYYKDALFIVEYDRNINSPMGLYSLCDYYNNTIKESAFEHELLSKFDWESKQQRNQNYIGAAAYNHAWDKAIEDFKKSGYGVRTENPKCVCGAHSIKDARHSNWCDIKN